MTFALHMGIVAEVVVKTALASGITLGALRLMAARSAAERSFVAHLGLAATLAIPFAALILPPMAVSSTFNWLCEIAVPMALYVLPALVIGGITLVAVARLFGLRNRATVLIEPAWLGALAHAQRRMGFKSGAALLVSSDIASPVSWGLFRPTIVLDQRALGAAGEAEAIIAHELAHVARADWAKLLLARITTALFWFNPLVWLLARQCHELREEAADDAVLRHEVDRSDYAAILVGHARHECRGLLLAANGVAPGKGSLRRRVTRVLDVKLGRAPAGLGFAAIGLVVGLLLGTPLAALTLRAPSDLAPPRAPVAPRAPEAVRPSQPVEPAAPAPWPELVQAALPATADRAALRAEALAAISAHDEAKIAKLTRDTLARSGVRQTAAARPYTPGELVAMSTQGVTPEWLRDMAALGYRDLSIDQIMSMAVQGVDPQYIREMAAVGYPRLSVDQLVAMRIQGVTPEFARAVNKSGTRADPDWLIAMRISGHAYGPRAAPHPPRPMQVNPRVRVTVTVPAQPPTPPRDTADDDN